MDTYIESLLEGELEGLISDDTDLYSPAGWMLAALFAKKCFISFYCLLPPSGCSVALSHLRDKTWDPDHSSHIELYVHQQHFIFMTMDFLMSLQGYQGDPGPPGPVEFLNGGDVRGETTGDTLSELVELYHTLKDLFLI